MSQNDGRELRFAALFLAGAGPVKERLASCGPGLKANRTTPYTYRIGGDNISATFVTAKLN
jgi:hypothetical protein